MDIVVLGGSPKGETSVTMQYVAFMQRRFPDHAYDVIQLAPWLRRLEEDDGEWRRLTERIAAADAVIWAFPVYFLMAPYNVKRFIELVGERDAGSVFAGKYATAVTTSVHYFDHTAHNYIHAISEDLGLHYGPGYSAEMYDLLAETEQQRFTAFLADFFKQVTAKGVLPRRFNPLLTKVPDYKPPAMEDTPKGDGGTIALLTDAGPADHNLRRMTEVFQRVSPLPVEVKHLDDFTIRGSCLGCCSCCFDGQCVYEDEFRTIYDDFLRPARAVVLAGTIRDRYLSACWKMFWDRSFYHGHKPALTGSQLGFLVSGPLRQLPDLRQVLDALGESVGLAGVVTDEDADPARVTALLAGLAARLARPDGAIALRPGTFLSVGGMKLFRDMVYSAPYIFRDDHQYYRRAGLYDFPTRKPGQRMRNMVMGWLMNLEGFRTEYQRRTKEGMLEPFRKMFGDGKE
ncbi:MAG: NAD(P)H-dependent oxidoreductase [Acidobacteria bacterium]|nr:NAD(P)H-dependent oxidoreductase [Acidobacteriota bacterium]